MIFLRLFYEFFKTGLFAVGGGLATLPFLYDMSDKTGWFTRMQLADMVAVSESTPGPIGVNMATFVGYETAGVAGAVVATLGLITPSVVVILLLAAVMQKYRCLRSVNNAFYGVRPASTGLISAAGLSVFAIALCDFERYNETGILADLFIWKGIALAFAVWLLTNVVKPTKKLHPIVFIAFSAVVGIVFSFAGV